MEKNLFIQLSSNEASNAIVEVFDIVGRQIDEFTLQITPGNNNFTLPFSENFGIYLANIRVNGQSISTKFINRK